MRRTSDELKDYAGKLKQYSTEELRDIYGHIHILRHPIRYKLLLRELEARGLSRASLAPPSAQSELLLWLEAIPFFGRHGVLKALVAASALLLVSAAVTFSLLLPIWLFEQPLSFRGIQTAIVYVAYAPFAPIAAASVGVRMGGRGVYFLCVVAGIAAGLWGFTLTGVPADIWQSVTEPQGPGGFSFGGF
jgi:hypothetical protein